jgi:ribosomal protein S18 acetylase RimI-like enzyme
VDDAPFEIHPARDEARLPFAHNATAIALYRKFGFAEEGLRVKHFRRASGELRDALEMGLPL